MGNLLFDDVCAYVYMRVRACKIVVVICLLFKKSAKDSGKAQNRFTFINTKKPT